MEIRFRVQRRHSPMTENISNNRKGEAILVYNRETGRVEPEIVMGERFVRLLYENAAGRLLARGVFRRRFFSRLMGKLQDTAFSARKIPKVARELGINTAEIAKPLEAYTTFNEFFTRRLKPGARPVDPSPSRVIAACDARLLAFNPVNAEDSFSIKGCSLDVPALLGDPTLADRYAGGAVLIYRLCPADYHRFHFPEACTPGAAVGFNGGLHSVNPIALATGLRILDTNLRERTVLEGAQRAGTICMVEVGALCVGSIVQTYSPGKAVERGAEKGMFRFGGSTVVVLYEPGRISLDDDIRAQTEQGVETLVKVGMGIGSYRG